MLTKRGLIFAIFSFLFIYKVEARQSSGFGMILVQDLETLYKHAENIFHQGDYETALLEFRRISSMAKEQRVRGMELRCLRFEGLLLWNIGRVSDSRFLFEKILNAAQGSSEQEIRNYSRAALNIIALYQEAKEDRNKLRYALSLKNYQKAIMLSELVGCDHLKTKCLRQMSLLLLDLENYSEFIRAIKDNIQIADFNNNFRELSYSLINYGLYFVINNDYIKALHCFQKAYEIANKYCELSIQTDCLNNIGVCYQYLGDYDRASSSIQKAISLITDPLNSSSIIDYYINIGGSLARSADRRKSEKDFSSAEVFLKKSLSLARAQKSEIGEVNALINLGFLSELRGYDIDALRFYSEALHKKVTKSALEQQALILCNLGNVNRKLAETSDAFTYYLKSEKIAIAHSFDHILWEIYLGQGICLRKAGKIRESIICMNKSIDIIESIKEINGRYSEILLNMDEKKQVYSDLVETMVESANGEFTDKNIAEMFNYIERANSRLYNDHSWKENNIGTIEYHDYKTKNIIPQSMVLTLREIERALLDNKTAIIEYSLGRTASFMICIMKNKRKIYRIEGTQRISDSISGYLRAISFPNKKNHWHRAAERISFELLPNIEDLWTSGIKHIIIVPDNILYLMPYESLRYNDRYLIERFSISYAQTSSMLANTLENNKKESMRKSYLGIGAERILHNKKSSLEGMIKWPIDSTSDYYIGNTNKYSPLPYCHREISNAYRLFHSNTADVLLGAEATETNAKNKLSDNYKIIHFACHGILGMEDPLNSALVLNSDPVMKEDGFLQAREIVNMKMKADLVLLSSCESGLETGSIGVGVMGISRAFINSGAKSVIASLWKINDRATEFLIRQLFEKMLAGYAKSEALRYAKLAMINSKYSHPYYWAAFVLNGEYLSCPFEGSN